MEHPSTRQDKTKQPLQNGHQRAESSNSSSQSKATKTIHKSPNGAKTKQKNTEDHEGQPESVVRHKQNTNRKDRRTPRAEKPQGDPVCPHRLHTKSTFTAKVGSTEATALFDSGTTLSCISKLFYDHISHTELSKVINTNARPAIIITSASDDKLINPGQCRLRIK